MVMDNICLMSVGSTRVELYMLQHNPTMNVVNVKLLSSSVTRTISTHYPPSYYTARGNVTASGRQFIRRRLQMYFCYSLLFHAFVFWCYRRSATVIPCTFLWLQLVWTEMFWSQFMISQNGSQSFWFTWTNI